MKAIKIVVALLLVSCIQSSGNDNKPLAPGKYQADPDRLELSGMQTKFTFREEWLNY